MSRLSFKIFALIGDHYEFFYCFDIHVVKVHLKTVMFSLHPVAT